MGYSESIMRWSVLLCGLSLPLAAAIQNVTVQGTTTTQAIIAYTAPDENPCTVEVSESLTFTPLVNDVNPALFPGANTDTRAGNLPSGQARVFVAGARRADASPVDARLYSRALQANTPHYFRITCGADSATGSFMTMNLPPGNGYMEPPQADAVQPGKTAFPTVNLVPRSGTIVDPHTGVLLKRVSVPRDNGSPAWDYTGTCTAGSGSNWSTPAAACSSTDGGAAAAYSGNGSDPLLLTMSTKLYPNAASVDYIKLTITGSGAAATASDRAIQACITLDKTNCTTPWKDVTLDQTSSPKTVCRNVPCDFEPAAIDTWREPQQQQIRSADINTDLCGNCTWGILIRKKTASADQIAIGYISIKIGTSLSANTSASGNHEVCSPVPSAKGFYHCTAMAPGGFTKALYAIHADTGEAHFLGRMLASDNNSRPTVNNSQILVGMDQWDKNDANIYYFGANDTGGNPVIMRGVFTGDDAVDAAPAATAQMTWTNITPGAFNLRAQAQAFDPVFNIQGIGVVGIQNNRIIVQASRSNQDSYGWTGVYDPGNGLPAGREARGNSWR